MSTLLRVLTYHGSRRNNSNKKRDSGAGEAVAGKTLDRNFTLPRAFRLPFFFVSLPRTELATFWRKATERGQFFSICVTFIFSFCPSDALWRGSGYISPPPLDVHTPPPL